MAENSGQDYASEAAPSEDKIHAADALEALARGDGGQGLPCPECGQVNAVIAACCGHCGAALSPPQQQVQQEAAPDTDPFSGATGPGDIADELVLTPLSNDPPQLSGDLAEMAGATGAGTGREPVKYRARPGMAPHWRYAIPPMAAMAVLMFAITAWAIAVLGGADLFVVDPAARKTRLMAMGMLLTLPVGLFLLFGCYVVWRDLKNQQNRPGARPPGRRNP